MSEGVEILETGGRIRLRLRVKPGSRRQRLIGAYGGALKLEVSAAPEKGRANAAVIQLLSETLGIRQNQVELVAGTSSQDKIVVLTGCSIEEITAGLRAATIAVAVGGNTTTGQGS